MVSAIGENPRKRSGVRYLKYFLHFAVFVGLAYAGAKYVNGELFWRSVSRFNWAYAPVVLFLTSVYVTVKGWRFLGMMQEISGAGPWLLLKAYVAGQACTILPGGMAARAGILSQVGIPPSRTAAPIAIAGIADQSMFVFVSVLAALWFESVRTPILILLSVLVALSLILGIEAVRTWLLGLIARFMGRFKLLEHWREFLGSIREVANGPQIGASLVNTAIAFLLMITSLNLCVMGVDARVPYMTLVLAYSLPTLLGRISAMPGGVGITEAGMISILNAAPGVSLDQAAVATSVFRMGTVAFAALLGGMVYVFAWRGKDEVAL